MKQLLSVMNKKDPDVHLTCNPIPKHLLDPSVSLHSHLALYKSHPLLSFTKFTHFYTTISGLHKIM